PEKKQPDGGPALAAAVGQRPARKTGHLRILLQRLFAGRKAKQDPKIDSVGGAQDCCIQEREASFRPDDDEVGERRKEAEYLDRMVVGEMDGLERLSLAASEERGDGVNHPPA